MLGPFRIRNLRRSTSPTNRASYAAASRRGSLDSLVSIKGQDYDYTVLMHPESKLKYLDEDDGEMVTVGTSLELSQRLDEPVSRLLRPRLDRDMTLGGGNNVFNPSSSLSYPTHVFEIDRRDDAVRIWEEIEERSRQLRASLASKQPETSTVAIASPSITPPGNNMTQQTQFADLQFQSLQGDHGTLSEALYPQTNDPQQKVEEVEEQNQLQQVEDEYTMFKPDKLAATEDHVASDEIGTAEDGSANSANRSRHLCDEKCERSDHKQWFQEASTLEREVEDKESQEEVLKELEAISSQDGPNVSHMTIPGRLSLDGASANICLDPNCAISLVDSAFLRKHLPGCPLTDTDPMAVRGIGETFVISNKFATFDLYIPCNGNKIAKMSRGARVVENLPVHVLVGTDIIVPEGITINFSKRLATITSCESLQVPLSIIQSTQEHQEDSLQKNEPLRGLHVRNHSETLQNWPTVSGTCRYCRRRKIRCQVAQTSSDGRCMNCVRFEQDCKFISKHGQAWISPPRDRESHRQWSHQSYYSPVPPHDPRLHYFTATNPPQLAHEKSEEADKPAHHTSMRVSDVLNDENEAKEVCEETAPLLESFTEGNLTAEGKRQAMEAGKRLRLRNNPAFQMIWNAGHGSQQMNTKTNRWAQYRSTESGNTAATRSSSTVPINELAQPGSSLLVSPVAHTQSASETEGSLLHAFRTELAKISNANNDDSVKHDVIQNNMCGEKAIVQEQPQVRGTTSGPELEAFTRNLILQTIASIGSNVETLKAQLQNHVLDVIPEHMNRPRATPIKYHLRNACSDFNFSIDAAIGALAVEPAVEDNTLSPSTVQLQPPLNTAIRSLHAMTYAFDTFSQRLRMIEDSKVPLDRNEADSSSLDHAGTEEYGEHKASQTAIVPVDSSKATVFSNAPPNEKVEAPIQPRNVGPSVRFGNTQTAGYKDSKDVSAAQNTIRHRNEPPITYRYVPSIMPLASSDTTRGRQPLQQIQNQTSALPWGLVTKPSPLELQYKRRSLPEIEHRRESRSRSRSPDASMAREMPAPRRFEVPNPQVQRSGPHSSLPIRHHPLASGSRRSNPERHSTLVHDAVSSGYRPLPQQRFINKAAHVRFGATSIYPPNGESVEDKNRLVAAASLRHSKSLSAIRKAPPPLNLTARKDADAKSRLSGTLTDNPVNDRKKAELHVLGSPLTANAPMSHAIPSSPLVATRFPTLEQFEDSNRRSVPQFPPLPSMEPLIPVRVNANKMGPEPAADTGKSQDSDPLGSRADQKLATFQKERAQQRKSNNESSGDFFRRMTGLDESSRRPNENTHFSSAPLGARLVKPFDPLAETATIHRHQLIEGVRRSATIGGLRDRYAPASRRLYSAHFDGNGRVDWNSFVEGHRNPRAQEESNQLLDQGNGDYHNYGFRKENSQRNDIRAQQTEGFASESTIAREEASTPLHHDASTVSAVQFCVDQLKDLGFGNEEDGGAQRLVVYAQAANGDLEVAMDMIDEERKAYKERS